MRKVLQSGATSIGDEKNQCKTFISTWMLWQSGFFLLALENHWNFDEVNFTKVDLKLKSEYSRVLDPFDKWKILNQNINWRMRHAVI